MNNLITSGESIMDVLKLNKFAVLATESGGQPHASLIAITPFENFRQLIFATYRNTQKYRNLLQNNKVAILIENGDVNLNDLQIPVVLTIIGHTEEISGAENEAAYQAHLKRHPEMESFMLSPDCALIMVIAQLFQMVYGIDDIRWITKDDLDAI
jgi:hypothetical protein